MIILTADKGVAVVVLDKKDYLEKGQNLLAQPAYRTIERDPTNKLKAKLITMLRKIKRESGLEETSMNSYTPQVAFPLSFIDCSKSIKLVPPKAYCIEQGIGHLWSV